MRGSNTGHRLAHSCHSLSFSSSCCLLWVQLLEHWWEYTMQASSKTWGGGRYGGPGQRPGSLNSPSCPTCLDRFPAEEKGQENAWEETFNISWSNTPTATVIRSRMSPWASWVLRADSSCFCRTSMRPGESESVCYWSKLLFLHVGVRVGVGRSSVGLIVIDTSDPHQGPIVTTKWETAHPEQCRKEQSHSQTALPPSRVPSLLPHLAAASPYPTTDSFFTFRKCSIFLICYWYSSLFPNLVINLFFENIISVISLVWLGGR